MGGLALVFAILLLFELMGLGLAVMARTAIACIALIPFMARLYPITAPGWSCWPTAPGPFTSNARRR
jgi:hypothetical protein